MSNFFTRSKDDMKYLFKNKEELSKKERKRKLDATMDAIRQKNEKEKGVAGVHLLVLY